MAGQAADWSYNDVTTAQPAHCRCDAGLSGALPAQLTLHEAAVTLSGTPVPLLARGRPTPSCQPHTVVPSLHLTDVRFNLHVTSRAHTRPSSPSVEGEEVCGRPASSGETTTTTGSTGGAGPPAESSSGGEAVCQSVSYLTSVAPS